MVIRHLKGLDITHARPVDSPGGAERAARLEAAAASILRDAQAAERRQREMVDGITDAAMRQSIQEQRRKLVG